MDAFWELGTDRPAAMGGIAPIPRSAMSDYIRTEGVTQGHVFRHLIRALDTVYLKVLQAKAGR